MPSDNATIDAMAAAIDTVAITLTVNGQERRLDVAPWTSLLDLLREELDLTGTKKGCDHGQCGACTVLVDGQRVNSCLTLAVVKDGARSPPSRGWPKAACTRSRPPSSSTTPSSAATAPRARSCRRWR